MFKFYSNLGNVDRYISTKPNPIKHDDDFSRPYESIKEEPKEEIKCKPITSTSCVNSLPFSISQEPEKKVQTCYRKGQFIPKNGISDKSKKIKKKKDEWNENYQLIQIQPPVHINNPKIHKKYFIVIIYKKGDKIVRKTIKFGDYRKEDFIDHHDETKRDKLLSAMKNYHSPLKANYWRYHLLNKYPDLRSAYIGLIKQFNLF